MTEIITEKEKAILAVKNDGFALEYASDELKADKEVVMAAVQNDGHAFKFASEAMKDNKAIFFCAASGHTSAHIAAMSAASARCKALWARHWQWQ